MILHCKHCHQQLTNSLFPTKFKYFIDWEDTDEDGRVLYQQARMVVPAGGFVKTKAYTQFKHYKVPAKIHIDRKTMLLPLPKYEPGLGCCDLDGEPVLCTCDTTLGSMQYDCWQTLHSVALLRDKVYHTFKQTRGK